MRRTKRRLGKAARESSSVASSFSGADSLLVRRSSSAIEPLAIPPPILPLSEDSERLTSALDAILEGAKTRFWLAVPLVYTSEDSLWLLNYMGRIADAKGRGVDVRVYLHSDPANSGAVSLWKEAGIPVVQQTPRVQQLHTGLIVTESMALLLKANLTDADLYQNANEAVFILDPEEIEERARLIRRLDGKTVWEEPLSRSHDPATLLLERIVREQVRTRADAHAWFEQTLYGRISRAEGEKLVDGLLGGGFIAEHEGLLESSPLGRSCHDLTIGIPAATALERFLALWRGGTGPHIEQDLLLTVCGLPQFASLPYYKREKEVLNRIRSLDSRLVGWTPGQLYLLGVASSLLSSTPGEPLSRRLPTRVVTVAREDISSLLRFLAKRGLERTPALPPLAIAAQDMATSLSYGINERGSVPLIGAMKRAREKAHGREEIAALYRQARAKGATVTPAGLHLLPPEAASYLANRPLDTLTLESKEGTLIARTPARGHSVTAHAIVQISGFERYVRVEEAGAHEIPLGRLDGIDVQGEQRVVVDILLIALGHEDLWNIAHAETMVTLLPPHIDVAGADAVLRTAPRPHVEREARRATRARDRLNRLAKKMTVGTTTLQAEEASSLLAEAPEAVGKAAKILSEPLAGSPARVPSRVQAVRTLVTSRHLSSKIEAIRPLDQSLADSTVSWSEGALIAVALLRAMGIEAHPVDGYVDGRPVLLPAWRHGSAVYRLPLWDEDTICAADKTIRPWKEADVAFPSRSARPIWPTLQAYLSPTPRHIPFRL